MQLWTTADVKRRLLEIIEHKHFEFGTQPKTILLHVSIRRPGNEAMSRIIQWTMIVTTNSHTAYKRLAEQQENVIFGGRLGQYRYYDMHQVIGAALQCVKKVKLSKYDK